MEAPEGCEIAKEKKTADPSNDVHVSGVQSCIVGGSVVDVRCVHTSTYASLIFLKQTQACVHVSHVSVRKTLLPGEQETQNPINNLKLSEECKHADF